MTPTTETFFLPFELLNKNSGQGHAWYQSANEKKLFDVGLKSLGLIREPYEVPVRLTITRILAPRQRLWDYDSVLRGNAKQLIDALVDAGWFHDDGPKWIVSVIGDQDASRRDIGPAIEIHVDTADAN